MPGKPYTMRELKQIVDYLTEHKLYGELKGRKMWMDFANTKKMDRTWQSMKETFQKRILPDIHNPYYKLTLKQISSFRYGTNHEEPDNEKFVVHGSDSNGDKQENIDQSSTSKKNNDITHKGKAPKKVSNKTSSTETLVLDNETVEDVQNEADGVVRHKPLRDLIVYSEPLTPMLQEVLDDFATDEDEPPLQIVEVNVNNEPKHSPTLIRESRSLKTNKDAAKKTESKTDKAPSPDGKESDKIKPVKLIKTQSGAWENKSDISNGSDIAIVPDATDSVITINSTQQNTSEDILLNTEVHTQSLLLNKTNDIMTNGTPDSLLPNNPEGFNASKITSNETGVNCSGDNTKSEEKKRKGEQSQAEPKRKLRKDKEMPVEIDKPNSLLENNKDDADTTKNDTSKNNENENISKNNNLIDKSKTNQETPKDSDVNPCLKSVSLYKEQFSQSKYSDCDDNEVSTTADKETTNNTKAIADSPVKPKNPPEKEAKDKNVKESNVVKENNTENTNEIVKSAKENTKKTLKEKYNDILITSDSDSDNCKVIEKVNTTLRVDRRKVLANVFGFTGGTVTKKRTLSLRDKSKRRYSHRRRTNTYSILNTVKSSGTTDYSSLSETDDIRPSPTKKKCYDNDKYVEAQPLNIMKCPGGGGLFVMDGNKLYPIVKKDKHVKNFVTIHDESDSESESYWKEKYLEQKRKNERLLKQTRNALPISNKESVTRATSPMIVVTNDEGRKSNAIALRTRSDSVKESVNSDSNGVSDKKVKIKIGKNYETVELECQPGEVIEILEKMKSIMSKANKDNAETAPVVLSSGKSTPVLQGPIDPDVRARVDKIESEIFKEIAEQDKIDENVNKKKRIQSRLSSTSTSNKSRSTSPKQTEKPVDQPKESVPSNDVQPETDAGKLVTKKTRAKKSNPEPEQNLKARTSARLSSVAPKTKDVEIPDDDSQVLYKFPTSASSSRSSSRAKKKTQKSNFPNNIPTAFQSPNETFGYQDTDGSYVNIEIRRKRKSINHQYKGRHIRSKMRRKSDPYQGDDDTNEGVSNITEKAPNSSLDPEAYKSESYQLLMPKPNLYSSTEQYLDKIEEGVANLNNLFIIKSDSLSPNTINITVIDKNKNGSPSGNSSNVSFPLSPELSIVENLSISKSLLDSVNENPPTINELQDTDDIEVTDLNKYLLSHIDVSVPLMEQEGNFLTDLNKLRKNIVSNSEGQNTVNMDEPSSSDSLDQRLRDLLLESAKKMSQTVSMQSAIGDQNKMEVDTTTTKAIAKKRTKKRCSTPCKRKIEKKSKEPIDPVIEEHTESCSHVSRNSCPAIIDVADKENNNVSSASNNKNIVAKKVRAKKDVIKVKIQKPKVKNTKVKRAKSSSRISVCTDSGINDTESGVFLQGLDDSIELIHNHSDTCLHANECVNDSVEFIDHELNSVISIESSPSKSANCSRMAIENEDEYHISETFCNNAQDVKAIKEQNSKETETMSGGTIYHTPNSNNSYNSLVTDDLSDEDPVPSPLLQNKPSKWYIWSEDDTNVDYQDAISKDGTSVGSNLHKIFPITCAIPDLSTITENSESRKATDTDTCNKEVTSFASPESIFDFN